MYLEFITQFLFHSIHKHTYFLDIKLKAWI